MGIKECAISNLFCKMKQYLMKALERFGIEENTKTITTPLASYFKLSEKLSPSNEEEKKYIAQVPYSSLVESLSMLWYVLDPIFLKLLVWLVNICMIHGRSIRKLQNGY